MLVMDGGHGAAEAVAACHAPTGPDLRDWAIVREGPPEQPRWVVLLPREQVATPSVTTPRFNTESAVGPITAACDPAEDTLQPDAAAAIDQGGQTSAVRGSEWMIGGGAAWSMDLLRSEGGRRYLVQTVSWAKDLTNDAGPGILRGRLLWGFEVMPVYAQTAPTSTYGVGLTPLVWRWRFVPRARAAAFAELAFGGLFTRDPVPEGTQSANFSAHGAFGIRWRPHTRVALVTAYRFQHLSNGNQLMTNPGVNAHVAWVGLGIR